MKRWFIRAKIKKLSIGFLKLKKVYKYIFHLKIYIHDGPSKKTIKILLTKEYTYTTK